MICLPIGFFLAFHESYRLGLVGIWIGLSLSLVYAAVIYVWICLRVDWDKEVMVVAKRINASKEAAMLLAIGTEELSSEEDEEFEDEEELRKRSRANSIRVALEYPLGMENRP